MVCEKCGQDVETTACGKCGTSVLKLGPFCYHCGGKLEDQQVQAGSTASGSEDDISTRILCCDGTCIGVINEAGVCKVCGKPYVPEN
jgi:hypothetical protein